MIEEVGEYFWEGADFRLTFERPPTPSEFLKVREVIGSWYEVGLFGGYRGYLHHISFNDRAASDDELVWTVDMGTADREALAVLGRCFTVLRDEGIAPISRVTVSDFGDDY